MRHTKNNGKSSGTATQSRSRQQDGGDTRAGLSLQGRQRIAEELRPLLADVFALYLKTKNFHWHIGGPHFRDYHLLLDEHADQLYDMTDDIAERARKLGQSSLHSISDISRHQRLTDNNEEFVAPNEMLEELMADNQHLAKSLRATHEVCEQYADVATASLIENWLDQTERRSWFLSQTLKH